MAGSYPDAPSRRIAYDADGTIVVFVPCNGDWPVAIWASAAEQTSTIKIRGNNEQTSIPPMFATDLITGAYGIVFIWPEPRDIYGGYTCVSGPFATGQNCEWSQDSPDGINGTWIDWDSERGVFGTLLNNTYSVENSYRGFITTWATHSASRVHRYNMSAGSATTANQVRAIHWYGEISAGYTPDRLLFIDNDTGLEFTGPLDWGDVPRGVTLDHDIKIKNNSASITANSTTLSFEALTGTSDTWYTIKETGGSFSTTLAISSIAAGATYPSGGNVITVRVAVGGTETLGPAAARLKTSGTTWP